MNILKGFVRNSTMTDNTPGVVPLFGELSARALTYAKEKGYYVKAGLTDLEFVAFTTKDNLGAPMVANIYSSNFVLELADYLYTRYAAATIGSSIPTLIGEIQAEFNVGSVTLTDIVINSLISDPGTPTKRLPDVVQLTFTNTDPGAGEFAISVWFSDTQFQSQYDDFEITVIPPFAVIDNFDDTNANVGIALASVTHANVISRINAARDIYSETMVSSVNYQWHELGGAGLRTTTWYVLIYGQNGNNPEAIRQAIKAYMSDSENTALDTSDWALMFPQVFDSSEYYLVPQWDNIIVAIPSIIYSPVIKPATAIENTQDNVAFTSGVSAWWEENVCSTSVLYQDLAVTIIGAVTNTTTNDYDFSLRFPDYMNIPDTHPDFGKMAPVTQGLVAFMQTLCETAEKITPTSSLSLIPSGYARINRGGKTYIGGTYDGTLWMAITRFSYTPT